MKIARGRHGKISEHFHGLGTVTREMVEKRAKELAMINGRDHVIDDDWRAAKQELLGMTDTFPDVSEEDTVAANTSWAEQPGTSGKHLPAAAPQDEQTFAETLVREGAEEAEHERMVEGSRPNREEEP